LKDRWTLLLVVLLICAGCGPVTIGSGIASLFGDDPLPDLGQPEVGIEILTGTGQSGSAPAFTNQPLVFVFKASKPGIGLSALVVGPIPTGADPVELADIETTFCDTGAPPTGTTVQVQLQTSLSTDPSANTAFHSLIANLADGRYVLHLLGTDAEGRRDCTNHEWILDTQPPQVPGLAAVEAHDVRELMVRWTVSLDPPGNPQAQPSGVSGYRVYFDVGSRAIPDAPRLSPPPLNGSSRTPLLEGGSGTSPIFLPGAANGTLTLKGLFAGRVHYVRVTAVDRAGNETDVLTALEIAARSRMFGDGSFGDPRLVPAGTRPGPCLVADFDRDGHLDVAVANTATPNVTLLYGNGDGTFAAPVTVVVGAGLLVRDLKAADFTNDKILELIVRHDTGFEQLKGSGNRAAPFSSLASEGATGPSLAVGDFDLDGMPDVAAASGSTPSISLRSLIGGRNSGGFGSGGFQDNTDKDGGELGADARCMTLADLDGDGAPDIVFCDAFSIGVQRKRKGRDGFPPGSVWFTTQQFSSGGLPQSLVVQNLNADKIPDIAVATANGALAVLIGNGDATFRAPSLVSVGSGSGLIATADFNGDGIADLALAGSIPNAVTILFGQGTNGRGDGTFLLGRSFALGDTPTAVCAPDLNRDGIPDLVVPLAGGSVSILLGNGARGVGDQTYLQTFVGVASAISLATADLNSDQVPDLAASRGAAGVDVLLIAARNGQATGGLFSAANFRPGRVESVVLRDIDGDRILDMECQGAGTLAPGEDAGFREVILPRLFGNGANGIADGTFRTARRDLFLSNVVSSPAGCDPAFQDVERAQAFGKTIGVILVGLSNFGSDLRGVRYLPDSFRSDVFLACHVDAVAVADVDGDIDEDVVAANGTAGTITVIGTRDFVQTVPNENGDPVVPGPADGVQTFDAGTKPARVAIADFNRDRIPDLVLVNRGTNDISMLLGVAAGPNEGPPLVEGAPSGRYPTRSVFPFSDEPTEFAVGDLNNDGIPDLAVLLGNARKVALLLSGNKTHTVTTGFDVPGSGVLKGIVIADFTSDHIPDIAIGGDAVRIFTGRGSVAGD